MGLTIAGISIFATYPIISALLCTGVSTGTSLLLLRKGEGNEIAKEQVSRFKKLFTAFTSTWTFWNFFVGIWTYEVFRNLAFSGGWLAGVAFPIAIMGISFVVLSIWSFMYTLMSVAGYYQGKKEGVGQVRSWKDVQEKYGDAKQRFAELLIPEGASINPDEAWKMIWQAMIDELYKEHKINQTEKEHLVNFDLSEEPKNEEAQERIQRYVGSWLMDAPRAEFWDDMPSLTAMITSYVEDVAYTFEDLNSPESGGKETRLNHLIKTYIDEWEEFAKKEKSQQLLKHAELIKQGKLLAELDEEALSQDLKNKIEDWAALRTQPVWKTVIEADKIREAYKIFARICFSRENLNDTEVKKLVDDKLQILLNYEGYRKVSPEQQRYIDTLMKKYSYLDVYMGKDFRRYNSSTGEIEIIAQGGDKGFFKPGKPAGQNQAMSFVRGEKVLFFDANASMRIEDAIKIPLGLAEFKKDPKLAEVLFAEYIYNKKYSWITEASAFGEETWVSVTQRILNMFGASGFYGHSAIFDTEALIEAGGIPYDYVSEDLMLAVKLWEMGYHTTHKEYLFWGKARETGYHATLTPFGKWSQGSAEMILGRWFDRGLRTKELNIAQKAMLIFALSFYTKKPLILAANFLYLGFIVFLGISGFVAFHWPLMFGILGLFWNQAINTQGFLYLVERMGIKRAIGRFISLFPKLFALFTAVIPTYATDINTGVKGKAVFNISQKGFNLKHIPFKEIWGNAAENLPASKVPLIVNVVATLVFTGVTFFFMPGIGITGLFLTAPIIIALTDFGISHIKPSYRILNSGIRTQMMLAIPMLAFTLSGLWLWGGIPTYPLIWAGIFGGLVIYFLGSIKIDSANKWLRGTIMGIGLTAFFAATIYGTFTTPIFLLFSFSIFYLGIPFTWLLMPLLAHARPFLWFSSKILPPEYSIETLDSERVEELNQKFETKLREIRKLKNIAVSDYQ
ncbi:MAG: glycosyltransferase family 2 protein, partial [Candidatus Njordarchaeales archaeon]